MSPGSREVGQRRQKRKTGRALWRSPTSGVADIRYQGPEYRPNQWVLAQHVGIYRVPSDPTSFRRRKGLGAAHYFEEDRTSASTATQVELGLPIR